MPTTSPDNIYYPGLLDRFLPQNDMSAMATSVQLALDGVRDEFSAFSGDTGLVNLTEIVTLEPGLQWSSNTACRARRVGPFVFMEVEYITTTVSGFVNVPVSGNVANTTLVSGVPEIFRPDVALAALATGSNGRVAAYAMTGAGNIRLAAITPSTTWTSSTPLPSGEAFSCTGVYLARGA